MYYSLRFALVGESRWGISPLCAVSGSTITPRPYVIYLIHFFKKQHFLRFFNENATVLHLKAVRLPPSAIIWAVFRRIPQWVAVAGWVATLQHNDRTTRGCGYQHRCKSPIFQNSKCTKCGQCFCFRCTVTWISYLWNWRFSALF